MSVKSDKVLICVFGVIGLALAVGFILLSIGGPDNSIVLVGAHRLPDGSGEMHLWILGRHVFSGPIAKIGDLDAYSLRAELWARTAVVIIGLLIGIGVGFIVSRIANRKRLRIVPRSSPKTSALG